jgi:phage terminase small subunit
LTAKTKDLPMPLTLPPRQQLFVDEYLVDLDARAAARRAGYSRAGQSYPQRLMRHPPIARAIAAAMKARALRTGITRERVLEEYARIAFADWRKLADWGPQGAAIKDTAALAEEAAAAVAMIAEAKAAADAGQLRLKTFDKLKALEALIRLLDAGSRADAAFALPPRAARPH